MFQPGVDQKQTGEGEGIEWLRVIMIPKRQFDEAKERKMADGRDFALV